MKTNLFRLATEGTDAVASVEMEREYAFHARLEDTSCLKSALSSEEHVQAQVSITSVSKDSLPMRMRIRRTRVFMTPLGNKAQEPTYIQTLKIDGVRQPGGPSATMEINDPISPEAFFALMMRSPKVMFKRRYTLPVQGHPKLKWEIDRFYLKDGEFSPWCKIDLEVPGSFQTKDLPSLPPGFHMGSAVMNQRPERTPEESRLVQGLYENLFEIPADEQLLKLINATA